MSLISKVARFARSPQGQKAVGQAKRFASDPKNRQKLDDIRRRLAAKQGK